MPYLREGHGISEHQTFADHEQDIFSSSSQTHSGKFCVLYQTLAGVQLGLLLITKSRLADKIEKANVVFWNSLLKVDFLKMLFTVKQQLFVITIL